jgi:hypothetical protein
LTEIAATAQSAGKAGSSTASAAVNLDIRLANKLLEGPLQTGVSRIRSRHARAVAHFGCTMLLSTSAHRTSGGWPNPAAGPLLGPGTAWTAGGSKPRLTPRQGEESARSVPVSRSSRRGCPHCELYLQCARRQLPVEPDVRLCELVYPGRPTPALRKPRLGTGSVAASAVGARSVHDPDLRRGGDGGVTAAS